MKSMKKFLFAVVAICAVFLGGCSGADNYKKGTLTATTFESEYLNLEFSLPGGYLMATEEEMTEMIDFGAEIAYSDVDKKIIDYSKANTVYEMMAQSEAGVPSVMIMVERLPDGGMSVDEYIVKVRTDLEAITDYSYVTEPDTPNFDFAGQTYKKLSATLNEIILQDYIIRKQDNRIIGIILTYTSDTSAEAESLLNSFKTIK